MTIWVLQQNLTPEEEKHIQERAHLLLPFDGLPDLSTITSPLMGRQLIKALHPDDPPEAVTRRFEYFWNRYSNLQIEDIIVVPLRASQQAALAEVMGIYQYRVGEAGADVHLIPVKWHKRVPLSKFRKHKELFASAEPMVEVANAEARVALRDHLPHSYNRFAKWKWLLVIFFLMGLVRMMIRLDR